LPTRKWDHVLRLFKRQKHRNVFHFDAQGDGLSDDGEAFQRALDAGPGVVTVPTGTYTIGRTLRIGSGTHLKLETGARLRLADGAAKKPDDYLLTNADPAAADISVEGGMWDGNNAGNPRPKGLFDVGYTGTILHFRGLRNLRLTNLHLLDAEAYHVRLTETREFHIEAIRFSSSRVRPNNDGIHLGGNCENGLIRDIKGLHPKVTGDDLVALNADDALERTEVKGMTSGPIRNVVIEDLAADGCHSFVRLLSVFSPIENVSIRHVRGSCEVAAINCDAARGTRVPLFDEKNPPFPGGVGLLRNIDIENLSVAKSSNTPTALLRLETRMKNFRLVNFVRNIDIDQAKNTPTLRLRYVEVGRMTVDGGLPTSLNYDQTHEITTSAISRLEII
jgi:hypothetical protein